MKKYITPYTEIVLTINGTAVMCAMTLYTGSPFVLLETITYNNMGFTSSDGNW